MDEERMVCETCWGEGSGEECELKMDWVNYGTAWVICPDCKGTGHYEETAESGRPSGEDSV